jgi:hypothetical protein
LLGLRGVQARAAAEDRYVREHSTFDLLNSSSPISTSCTCVTRSSSPDSCRTRSSSSRPTCSTARSTTTAPRGLQPLLRCTTLASFSCGRQGRRSD